MQGTRTFVYGGLCPPYPRPVSDDDIDLSINRYRFIVSTIWTTCKKMLSTFWTKKKSCLRFGREAKFCFWLVDGLTCRRFFLSTIWGNPRSFDLSDSFPVDYLG